MPFHLTKRLLTLIITVAVMSFKYTGFVYISIPYNVAKVRYRVHGIKIDHSPTFYKITQTCQYLQILLRPID